ncbi:MAG: coenzyme F420-0:L-glutamate ligase [Gammaproteobacteria bacterium]
MTAGLRELRLSAVAGVPAIKPGDDLAGLLLRAIEDSGEGLGDGDVLVIAQKVVSKAEGRYVALDSVQPSPEAQALAVETDKDPRLVHTILSEARDVVRHRPGVIVVTHRLGFVMANAGIDRSNLEPSDEGERVLLLPVDPDASARALKQRFDAHAEANVAVIINDSVGRAFRTGTIGIALGAAGLPSFQDLRGDPDMYGRTLEVSQVGLADQLASAASLLMGEGNEAVPLVVVRGLAPMTPDLPAATLIRDPSSDLFR